MRPVKDLIEEVDGWVDVALYDIWNGKPHKVKGSLDRVKRLLAEAQELPEEHD